MLHSSRTLKLLREKKRPRLFSSPLIIGIVLIVTFIVGSISYIYAVNTEEKERTQLLTNLTDKADVLVWALEGSARTMMGTQHMNRPFSLSADLLEEIANQPGIMSICLVNKAGEILLHSDPDTAPTYANSSTPKILPPEDQLAGLTKRSSIGRFGSAHDAPVYEVIKLFTPADPHHSMRRHKRHRMMMDTEERTRQLGPLYMIVAFDSAPYAEYMEQVRHKNMLFSILVTIVTGSLAAFALVLFNFFRSHKLLNDARALASQIVTNLPIGIITTDIHGSITLFNSQSLHLLSLEEHAIPQSIKQLPHLNWQEIMDHLDTSPTPILEEEVEIPLGEAESRTISLSAAKVLNSDGSASGYLCILRNLQTVKSLQRQIRLNERLAALSNMAAGVAHEIRNPLSTLKGYATYLSEKLKNDPQAHAMGTLMIEEVERLNRVVTDLLFLSKPSQLQFSPVNLAEIVAKAVRLVAFDAQNKNIAIHLTGEETPLPISGDADRLLQALLNILLNAVQAIDADSGSITVNLHKEIQEKTSSLSTVTEQYALIRIRDTGQGMSKETLANIFTPYFSTKASGTGLGMTITHQIIDLHEGSISVASVLNEGTTFTIRLPLQF